MKSSIDKDLDSQRLCLTIAYIGTAYYGWQCQSRKNAPPLATVQASIERAASAIAKERVIVQASGRTDSGVHANAQVAHMDIPKRLLHIDWALALNQLLPADIRIVSARAVSKNFHAQRSAVQKTYAYRLWLAHRGVPPFIAPFVWPCGPLDNAAMEEAAAYLVGKYDFSAFQNVGTPLLDHVRTITDISQKQVDFPNYIGFPFGQYPEEAVWYFTANGFLKQMVRNLMGLLVTVGRGKLSPQAVPDIIASKDRKKAPATAPARALTLWCVEYEK